MAAERDSAAREYQAILLAFVEQAPLFIEGRRWAMRRLEALTAWFCMCLGITLLGVSILVAPAKAFAEDPYQSCGDACCSACFGSDPCDGTSSCYLSCDSTCFACVGNCNGDSGCIASCIAGTGGCSGSPKCDIPNNPCYTKLKPSCPNTNTNCANGTQSNACDGCKCAANTNDKDIYCRCLLRP